VAAALVFRKQLSDVIGTRLHRLKAGPLEMELFDRKLVETGADVDPIPAPAKVELGTNEIGSRDLDSLAQHSPAAPVVDAHARVEQRLREILMAANLTTSHSSSVRQLARTAAEHRLITEESVRSIEGITVLRNLAAHGNANDLTPTRAQEYIDLIEAVLYSLN
jgi:hypothetical protein